MRAVDRAMAVPCAWTRRARHARVACPARRLSMQVPCSAVQPWVEQDWLERALATPQCQPGARVWIYRDHAIVTGRAQVVGTSDMACRVLRRPTGGSAVYVGPWMIGVSAVLPRGHALVAHGVIAAYRWLGLAHARWLRQRGIRATVHRVSPPLVHDELDWACFAGLSSWELGVDGRKITGLAQARRGDTVVLSAGTLLRPTPWQALCDATGHPDHAAMLEARTADCQTLLGHPIDTDDWARSLQLELGRWLD